MTLDLKKELKDLKNESIIEQDGTVITIGKILANVLASQKQNPGTNVDSLRSYMLAVDLYNKESISPNESDLLFIENALKGNDIYTPIITGQAISMLNEMKKKDEQSS